MRRGLKVISWVVVLAACAGVGAYIASRTNPFPPGVEDPGARPTEPASPSEAPDVSWVGSGVVRSTHRLFVGGSCQTNWGIRMVLRSEGNRVEGDGVATLRGDADCDFPIAQVQTRRVRLEVEGRIRGTALLLRFTERVRTPAGSIDLGAFVPLLDRLSLRLGVDGETAAGDFEISVPDGDRGSYEAAAAVRLNSGGA